MKRAICSLSLVLFGLFAATCFAGSMPDYHCGDQLDRCEKACDRQAEESKNANAYQRCLDRCTEMNQKCEARQSKTTECAEAYMDCIKDAKGDEAATESCREAYRNCKG
jgi:hypothetical protein